MSGQDQENDLAVDDDDEINKEEQEKEEKEPDAQCKHYIRRCTLECPICLKYYPCRVCHDENESHELNRREVKNIQCCVCDEIQESSKECKSCQTEFGKYFCSICNMFDDRERGQFHCNGCGLCRIGGKDNFFHCDICDMCFSNNIKDSHKCLQNASKSNCPVCMTDLHTSRRTIHVPACGHLIHMECHRNMLSFGNFRCPMCGKSTVCMTEHWKHLDNEIANTPMPAEYENVLKWILCKDCQAASSVKFHVLGMKCAECGSYNTCEREAPMQNAE